jgi:hypothetical protein
METLLTALGSVRHKGGVTLIYTAVGNVETSYTMLGEKFKWRTHGNESGEKSLNLEKH